MLDERDDMLPVGNDELIEDEGEIDLGGDDEGGDDGGNDDPEGM